MTPAGQQEQATTRPEGEGDRAAVTLSLAALIAVLAAGFVLALGQAEPSPTLTNLISTLLH